MSRVFAILAACAALAASAESNTLTGQPGFFKATPDGNSSISRIVPPPVIPGASPEAEPAPAFGKPGARDPIGRLVPEATVAATEPDPAERVRQSEAEMDRANREHRDMSQRSALATSIAPGAYNGATNERDR